MTLKGGSCSSTLRLKRTWVPPRLNDDDNDANPEYAWILASYLPVVDLTNSRGIMGCLTDISKFKWAEEIQANAARVAKEAKEKQEKFMDITRCGILGKIYIFKLTTTRFQS